MQTKDGTFYCLYNHNLNKLIGRADNKSVALKIAAVLSKNSPVSIETNSGEHICTIKSAIKN